MIITAEKTGNLATLSSGGAALPPDVEGPLRTELTYTYRASSGFNRPWHDAATGQRLPFIEEPRVLYRHDVAQRLVIGTGLLPRVQTFLAAHGHLLQIDEADPPGREAGRSAFTEDWDRLVAYFDLRACQDGILAAIASATCGVIVAGTGVGKGDIICMIRALYPKANIHVVVQGRDLVRDLVGRLERIDPTVGQVGAGSTSLGRKTTVFSADSLGRSDYNADFLLCDELHKLAAPSYLPHLARYRWSRNFGLTATFGKRMDGADAELECLFGPVIYELPYQDAVASGLVVPIRVEWLDVHGDDPVGASTHPTVKKRRGIWRNQARNEIFAEKALSYPDDDQVLVMVETVEHALYLRDLLPGFRLCYSGMSSEDLEYYRRHRLMGDEERPPTTTERENMRLDFESGALKKVIATGVWAQGVNFKGLQVLVRADACNSAIKDTQIPGRVCRLDGADKQVGILIDGLDQFNQGFHRRALERKKNYQSHGWEQVMPRRSRGA